MIVLDTNVLSELAKSEPHAAVLAWVARQRRAELYTTTTISEAELAYGLALLSKGRRRDALTQAVARLLGEGLGGRVLAFDRGAAAAYGEIAAKRRAARCNRGRPDCRDRTRSGCQHRRDPGHGRLRGMRDQACKSLGGLMTTSVAL